MMKRPNSKLPELLQAMNFPKKGEVINKKQVLDSKATMDYDVLRYEIHLPKGTRAKHVPTLLRNFYSTQVIPTADNLVVRAHDYSVKPGEGKVVVSGAMHIIPVVRANPGVQEFDEEYSSMEMQNPETYFRVFPYSGFNSPQFRAKLFSFVGYMGENYGYCDAKNIYHRRASLVMPKIKITKAIPQAKMMYHTHPSKDEPSLSSPDDYLLYMDLSHEPRSIRHFMTVMKDRMDHFEITPKKGAKADFLKLDEGKLLEEIDAHISELEKKWEAKTPLKENTPKKVQDAANLEFCENITRDLVKWMNKKYGKYFSFKYHCYYRVKKNPEGPVADDLHLDDEFLMKGIADINSGKYSWPEFKTSEMPHENYAYWHQMYYKQHVKDSFMSIGVVPHGGSKRKYDQYMAQPFEAANFSNFDALNILNLAYDISKSDEKVRDGSGTESRLGELCEYLEVEGDALETLTLLEDIIRNEDVYSDNAKTMAGDYYPLVILSDYSIKAIEAIKEVQAGKKELEIARFEIYNLLKQQAGDALIAFLYREGGKGDFVDSLLNPPSISFRKAELATAFPPEALDFYDPVADALTEFSASRYDATKPFFFKGRFNLRVPTQGGLVTMMITQSTGNAQIFVTTDKDTMEVAMEAVDKVGTALYRAGLPVDPDVFNVTALEPAMNPAPQVIAICGPSGSGKSTTIRNLLKALPNAKTIPTYTTRQKRKSDKAGEREFVSASEFKRLMASGEMIMATLQKNGNYYGRKRSDFEGANYVLVDVSLSGLNDLKRTFPNTFSVYLEPVEDPEFIRKRLLRRGDMSPQEARKRAEIIPSHIKSSLAMNFDLRIKTQQGKFDYPAKEIMGALPRSNPLNIAIGSNINFDSYTDGLHVGTIGRDATIKTGRMSEPGDVRVNDDQKTLDDYGIPTHDTQEADLTDLRADRVRPTRLETKVPSEMPKGQLTIAEAIAQAVGTDEDIDEVADNPVRRADPVGLERFTKWVRLVNMKNKELKVFLDSDLGKQAGINKERQKEFGGINRGRTSGLAILRMRAKLGLTGPKDYIQDGPMIIKRYYNMALEKWNETDWYWCGRQISFNSRARGQRGAYTDKKGRPTRKLLALWVWGHDPWRYARKVEKKERMPPCPNVPWIGMTEKRKWGTTEFVYKNPGWFGSNKVTFEDSFGTLIKGTNVKADPLNLNPLAQGESLLVRYPMRTHPTWVVVNGQTYTDEEIKTVQVHRGGQIDVETVSDLLAKHEQDMQDLADESAYDRERNRSILERLRQQGRINPGFIVGKPTEHSFQIRIEPEDADPIKLEALRAATDKSFKHHEWYVIHHLDYVMKIAKQLGPELDQQIIEDMVWLHDYPKMLDANNKDDYTSVRKLLVKHRGKKYANEVMNHLELMEEIKTPDWNGESTPYAAVMSAADALAHYYGPFWQIYMDENTDKTIEFLTESNDNKRIKDRNKLRALPGYEGALDNLRFKYSGRNIEITGNEHIAKLVESPLANPRGIAHMIKKALDPEYREDSKHPFYQLYLDEDYKDDKARIEAGELLADEFGVFTPKSDPYKYLDRVTEPGGDIARRARKKGKGSFAFGEGGNQGSLNTSVVKDGAYQTYLQRVTINLPQQLQVLGGIQEALPHLIRQAKEDRQYYAHDALIDVAEKLQQEGSKAVASQEEYKRGMISTHKIDFDPNESLVGRNLMELYDGFVMLDTQTATDHEFAHRADTDIVGIDYEEYSSTGANLVEASAQQIEGAYTYAAVVPFLYYDSKDAEYATQASIVITSALDYSEYRETHLPGKDNAYFKRIHTQKLIYRPAHEVRADLLEADEQIIVNPRTPGGKKFPTKYLKGLTPTEKAIAIKEIDKGYKYSLDDPKAYKYWVSDIKATARGYQTVPSKYQKKFIQMYGPLPEEGDFLTKMSKATGVKKSILQKVYDKGLAAWRIGHRPGVQQHQWAAGRVYSFVTLGNTVFKGGKKMSDHSLAVEAGLIKDNPGEWRHGEFAEDDPFDEYF